MTKPTETLRDHGCAPWRLDGVWRYTTVDVPPDLCVPGTDRPRSGVLVSLLDVLLGSPPSGVMNPTIDLQLRLFSPPTCDRIYVRARTLRLGRTLYVGEAELRHDPDDDAFGVGIATFMNRPVPFPERLDPLRDGPAGALARVRTARRVEPGQFELDADLDTPQGTVSGATLACLAELASIDLLGGAGGIRAVVDELDLRFLNKVFRGPIAATAAVLARGPEPTVVRVEIVDRGDHDRLITHAVARCRVLAPTGVE